MKKLLQLGLNIQGFNAPKRVTVNPYNYTSDQIDQILAGSVPGELCRFDEMLNLNTGPKCQVCKNTQKVSLQYGAMCCHACKLWFEIADFFNRNFKTNHSISVSFIAPWSMKGFSSAPKMRIVSRSTVAVVDSTSASPLAWIPVFTEHLIASQSLKLNSNKNAWPKQPPSPNCAASSRWVH